MIIQENTIIKPVPNAELLAKRERNWRLKLPTDYRDFLMKYNGCIPSSRSFLGGNREYVITRFLCVLEDFRDTNIGWYDISVVESLIGERLTENGDLIGVEVLPIAELFAGDYACLDFRTDKDNPCVCVWSHEESGEFDPITYWVADTFSEFLEMLI